MYVDYSLSRTSVEIQHFWQISFLSLLSRSFSISLRLPLLMNPLFPVYTNSLARRIHESTDIQSTKNNFQT